MTSPFGSLNIQPSKGLAKDLSGLASGFSPGGNPNLLSVDTNPDELGQLNQLVLKTSVDDVGVSFPGILFKEEQTKSLKLHTFPHLDGARIENMGRDAGRFHVRAILTNNIYPGLQETWIAGKLFPDRFNALVEILVNNNDLVFEHPLYGGMTVQVQSWSYELNPKGPRDGAIVDISLIETIVDENISTTLPPAPGSSFARAANDLDNAYRTVASLDPTLNPNGLGLNQFFGSISGTIDNIVSFPSRTVDALTNNIVLPVVNGVNAIKNTINNAPSWTINNIKSDAQNIKNAVAGSPIKYNRNFSNGYLRLTSAFFALNNTASTNAVQFLNKVQILLIELQQWYIDQNSPIVAPNIVAIRQLLLQVQQIQSSLRFNTINQYFSVRNYVTQTAISWMELARLLNNNVDDLLSLNQDLITDIFVPNNTTINYYQS